jgi:hypothetical protein
MAVMVGCPALHVRKINLIHLSKAICLTVWAMLEAQAQCSIKIARDANQQLHGSCCFNALSMRCRPKDPQPKTGWASRILSFNK